MRSLTSLEMTEKSAIVIKCKLQNLACRVFRILKLKNVSADIILLPHRDMASLKRRYFKKLTEPNVLSFPEPATFPHPETRKRHLGEIYLNRDILAREPDRATPLLTHGLLHLLGHDHKKKPDAIKMERLEVKILRVLS